MRSLSVLQAVRFFRGSLSSSIHRLFTGMQIQADFPFGRIIMRYTLSVRTSILGREIEADPGLCGDGSRRTQGAGLVRRAASGPLRAPPEGTSAAL